MLERTRIYNLRRLAGSWGTWSRVWDASQSWILVILVGSCTGWLAACIDISEQWMSDLKNGYCSSEFYLDKHFCCYLMGDSCTWYSWNGDSHLLWLRGYFMYILCGTFFAFCSAFLVKQYAPFSAGSGIPEVKTILSGFVMRKFLAPWTLVIKCIGLVLAVSSGLSLGKEGPLVHVACCVAYLFSRFFQTYRANEAKTREILVIYTHIECRMCRWCQCCFWCPYWRSVVFARRGILLFSLSNDAQVILYGHGSCYILVLN